MAGAILGINTESDPPVEVLDADLFRFEANRLSNIAEGGKPPSHQYPDLLHWYAPETQAERPSECRGWRDSGSTDSEEVNR